jgi:1,4-alpha-glucan branching enzyme
VKRFLPGTENRVQTGLKLHRITGPSLEKDWYDRESALAAVQGHARHFVDSRIDQCEQAGSLLGFPPLVPMPYDAELFGHWWFEGPEFLDAVVRMTTQPESPLEWVLPSACLKYKESLHECIPAASSWGENGYLGVWLDPCNGWIQPRLRAAERLLFDAAKTNGGHWDEVRNRFFNQAARELLLAQSSDWPFLIRMGTASAYAARRVEDHLGAVRSLVKGVDAIGPVEMAFLETRERQFNLFPELDAKELGRK